MDGLILKALGVIEQGVKMAEVVALSVPPFRKPVAHTVLITLR